MNILDLIDGAVSAHELSSDAMRWTPEPGEQPIVAVLTPERVARLFHVPPELLTDAYSDTWTWAGEDR